MKKFLILAVVAIATTICAPVRAQETNPQQFYPPAPAASSGRAGTWVPFSHEYEPRMYAKTSPYVVPWETGPVLIDTIVPNCKDTELIVFWHNDHQNADKRGATTTTGGQVPIPVQYPAGYGLRIFAADGFSFTGPHVTALDDNCLIFVSGRRWIPNSR